MTTLACDMYRDCADTVTMIDEKGYIFEPSSFDVQVVLPFDDRESLRTRNHARAVDAASSWVGPNRTQVTITARSSHPSDTFAIRHFTWKDGAAHDSGWRVWIDSEFRGAGTAERTTT